MVDAAMLIARACIFDNMDVLPSFFVSPFRTANFLPHVLTAQWLALFLLFLYYT
jgi:hypothetical protein